MKRQNLRKGIILLSFFLFPITLYYFSPYLIILGASEGVLSGSFIVFIGMFILSLFFGRAFCGWLCPAGGAQECMMLASNKKAKGGKLNYIKYAIWLPWILTIVFLLIVAKNSIRADFFYQTTKGISLLNPMAYFIYYAVLFLIVILSLISGRRSFCHYVCWMAPFMVIGTKIKGYLKYPSLQLSADRSKCVGCRQCTNKCPMSLEVEQMVKKESMKNSECILCGECVDICPKSVIKFSKERTKE